MKTIEDYTKVKNKLDTMLMANVVNIKEMIHEGFFSKDMICLLASEYYMVNKYDDETDLIIPILEQIGTDYDHLYERFYHDQFFSETLIYHYYSLNTDEKNRFQQLSNLDKNKFPDFIYEWNPYLAMDTTLTFATEKYRDSLFNYFELSQALGISHRACYQMLYRMICYKIAPQSWKEILLLEGYLGLKIKQQSQITTNFMEQKSRDEIETVVLEDVDQLFTLLTGALIYDNSNLGQIEAIEKLLREDDDFFKTLQKLSPLYFVECLEIKQKQKQLLL